MGFAIITALLTACQRAGTPLNATAVGNFGRFPPFHLIVVHMQEFELLRKTSRNLYFRTIWSSFSDSRRLFWPPQQTNPLGSLDLRSIFYELKAFFCTKMEIRPAWAWFSSLKVPWLIYETLCQMIIGQRGGFLCPISVVVKILLEPAVISTALLQKRIFFIEL